MYNKYQSPHRQKKKQWLVEKAERQQYKSTQPLKTLKPWEEEHVKLKNNSQTTQLPS